MVKKEFETFRGIGDYDIRNLTQVQPSCFNGMVNFRKVKITIEQVEEPIEVLSERLQELWDKSDNYHDYEPLVQAAKTLGYKFNGSRGNFKTK